MGENSSTANWHQNLPSRPGDFPRTVNFEFAPEESEYLIDRISQSCTGTLLQYLLGQRSMDNPPFPWQHPLLSSMPALLTEQLMHARMFSGMMHGAMLLYNFYLAREVSRDDLRVEYAERLSLWWDRLKLMRDELLSWDTARLWDIVRSQNSRIHPLTRGFVETWIAVVADSLAAGTAVSALAESTQVFELIRQRERQIKRSRARLSNRRAREMWGGASGTARLDYRWSVTTTMLRDILTPVGGRLYA